MSVDSNVNLFGYFVNIIYDAFMLVIDNKLEHMSSLWTAEVNVARHKMQVNY